MEPGRTDAMLIAGGGIGGLATALTLARQGIESIVLERRAVFSEAGAGIQLGPNGMRILRQLGVDSHLAPDAARPDALTAYRGRDARVLSRMPLGRDIEARHGAPYWVAHRADLQKALLAAVADEPLISVVTGCDVTAVTQSDDGVRIVSRCNGELKAPGLIAADGVWSTVRRDVLLAPPAPGARHTAARTVIPAEMLPPLFQANEVGVWLAPAAHVVHYPVRAGREVAVIVVVEGTWLGDDWSSPADLAEVLSHLHGFSPVLQEFISLGREWRKWSLAAVPPLRQWSEGRVTLLGDAAHPPVPFLAQGGVMALEDAVTVADALAAAKGDVAAAFRAYEQVRKPRIARVLAASIENGRIYHHSGLMAAARDLTLRLVPPRRILARYDWLYGWRPPRTLRADAERQPAS